MVIWLSPKQCACFTRSKSGCLNVFICSICTLTIVHSHNQEQLCTLTIVHSHKRDVGMKQSRGWSVLCDICVFQPPHIWLQQTLSYTLLSESSNMLQFPSNLSMLQTQPRTVAAHHLYETTLLLTEPHRHANCCLLWLQLNSFDLQCEQVPHSGTRPCF